MVHERILGLEGLAPKHIGGHLVPVIEGEAGVAVAQVEGIFVADGAEVMALGVVNLARQSIAECMPVHKGK